MPQRNTLYTRAKIQDHTLISVLGHFVAGGAQFFFHLDIPIQECKNKGGL